MNWTTDIPSVLAGAGSAAAWREAQDTFVSNFLAIAGMLLLIAVTGFFVIRAVWKSGQ